MHEGATLEELQAYYLQMGPKLLRKWVKAGAVHAAIDKENPLGQWRERIETIDEIELPLPRKKEPRPSGNGGEKRFKTAETSGWLIRNKAD